MTGGRLLFIDDERDMREAAAQWLGLAGFDVILAKDGVEAIECLRCGDIDVVITDIRMPRKDGMALLDTVLEDYPSLPVILLTGHGTVPLAVEAMRRGAYEFLEKPYDPERLAAVASKAAERRALATELARLRAGKRQSVKLEDRIIGQSLATRKLRSQVERLTQLDCDVIITGETGAGKEVVSRALHDFGRRRGGYVAVNCAAIPAEMFESELFGHEAGAFTGAKGTRVGKFEYAQGGTLLLDEIESMPLGFQAKLLRVLQERSVERLGSNRPIPLSLRVMAATKEDLVAASRAGRFRSDLYFRLNVAEIRIPPLREREDDVLLLFAYFVEKAAERHDLPAPPINDRIMNLLRGHDWPGNVRELRTVAERYALGLPSEIIQSAEQPDGDARTLAERLAAYEKTLIADAIVDADGDMARVCETLGLPRRTLNEKMMRHGISRAEMRQNRSR
jgi:two-component system, NtrC family, C4-dicarboxylate transport response regulator DctD